MSADPSLADPAMFEATPEERQWAMFAHLAALVAMWLGGLGFLGPLVIWLIKKDTSRFIDDKGKALNFQLNMLLAGIVLGMLAGPLILFTLGLGFAIVVPLALALVAYGIVMPILAALKVNAGETYRYPFIIRIVS
jgi:hypothetical protein